MQLHFERNEASSVKVLHKTQDEHFFSFLLMFMILNLMFSKHK